MVGLGETDEEILQTMRDMREHHIDMLTIGQYLAPSSSHLPVQPLRSPRHIQNVGTTGLPDGLQARRCRCHGRAPATTRTPKRITRCKQTVSDQN